MSANVSKTQRKNYAWIWIIVLILCFLGIWFVSDKSRIADQAKANAPSTTDNAAKSALRFSVDAKNGKGMKSEAEEWPPKLKVIYTYDSVTINGKKRSLVAKSRDSKYVPDSDAASGFDLWIQDENGHERLVDPSVYRAKFSPDGEKIAYGTADANLHVEDLSGNRIAYVDGAYDPNWSPDGKDVVFSKVPPEHEKNQPGAFQLAILDPATGKVKTMTDGNFDDGRPEFDPTGHNILFVSGGRSGLASFWMITDPNAPPVQITNVGQDIVNDKFVPTPYTPNTIWAPDGQWFIYDYKQGDREETWGLKFDKNGHVEPMKLASGTQPRWKIPGQIFLCQTSDGKTVETALP